MTPPDRLFLDFQAAVAGRYSLERELGRGGMGIVYVARDLHLERVVAVKLLPPTVAAAPGVRERFLREARTAAGLSHPHIIPIHAVEETGAFVYFVMAYVDGESLGARIRSEGPLGPHEAARVLREVAWGLAYAHGHGVVHRDVKPDNILLEREGGRALIADFGIARVVTPAGVSGDGELIGTPEYVSPEQASAAPLDGRSDLYSLGIVGYYALTGTLPFTGRTVASLLTQHLAQPPPPLAVPGAPRQLVAAIERCLAKDPAERFQRGEDLAAALSAAVESRRDPPVPVRAFITEGNPRARARMMAAWVAAAALVPAGMMLLLRPVFPGAIPPLFENGVLAIGGLLLGAAAATPLVFEIRRIRRLLRAGYAREDVLHGLTLELERRREEVEYMHGGKLSPFARLMRLKSYASLALAALSGAAAFVLPYPAILLAFGVFGLASATAVATGLAAHAASRRHLEEDSRRLRFWRGPIGRWLFRLARLGRRGIPALPPADRPTEVALGAAAVELFEGLPKETRRVLGDLPDVVRQLEAQVGRLRSSGREAPLGEALGALEAVRVNLLRLHGGIGTVDGLTANLAAAREIGTVVDALLESGAAAPEAERE